MLGDLLADLQSGHRVESTVFVECMSFYRADGPDEEKYVGETEFVCGVAAMARSGRYGPIRACEAIVSRADLSAPQSLQRVLEQHVRAGGGRLRGIRHAAGWDSDPAVRNSHTSPPEGLYARPEFREGFALLSRFGLIFESWQYHTQLGELWALARQFPETPIVLDHVGGPLGIGPYAGRRDEVFKEWAAGVRNLARLPNVWVKLGGLGMSTCGFDFPNREAAASSGELADAWRPYIETCIEAFGTDRSMFESNYPVDRACCTYPVLWNAFKRIAKGASAEEKAALFCNTARTFYGLAPQV